MSDRMTPPTTARRTRSPPDPDDRERPRPARAVAGQRRPRRVGAAVEAAALEGRPAGPEGPLLGEAVPRALRRGHAREEHGAARQGPRQVGPRRAPARGVRPRLRRHPARARHPPVRRADSPPASSCTSAGSSNWPPARARPSPRRCPTFLNALVGKGVHVTTVNDYLAKRDAEWIGPVYQQARPDGRRASSRRWRTPTATAAYRRDVTYGTASEFGFDFLRDRLKVRGGQAHGRAVLGAVDARRGRRPSSTRASSAPCTSPSWTRPTASSSTRPGRRSSSPTRPGWPSRRSRSSTSGPTSVAREMKRDEHFTHRPEEGQDRADRRRPAPGPLLRTRRPASTRKAMDKLLEAVEQALHAHYRFGRDQHYMINNENKIVIIDEGTGRPMPDRHWRDGLHQAVEAKERRADQHGQPTTRPRSPSRTSTGCTRSWRA